MSGKTAFALFASVLLLTQVSSIAFANTMPDYSNLQNTIPAAPAIDKSKLNSVTLPFIQNNGQKDSQVKFYANLFSGTVFVTEKDLTYLILQNNTAFAVKENFDAKYDSTPSGLEKSQATLSSFVGDKKDWASDVPTFNSISLGELWDFIDVNLIAHGNNVEKLFLVSPGGNVNDIGMKVDGANSLQISDTGELIIDTDSGKISMTAPVAFQIIDGKRKDIPVSYAIDGVSYGFVVSDYDHSVLLTIDPLLASTFIGGSGFDSANAITLDSTGRVYVTGYTTSTNYPVTSGAYDELHNGSSDVFISRFDAELSTLQKSTLIGGGDDDSANAIAIDSTGRIYVTGETSSIDYPATLDAYDEITSGYYTDIFISRFDADLSTLQKSTFIGGTSIDSANAIALDSTGRVYVTGYTYGTTTDFPITPGAYDVTHDITVGISTDVVVSRFNADLSTLERSTFIGGTGSDRANAIAIDSTGRVYVTGYTVDDTTTDYPVTFGAYDETPNSVNADIFISRFDAELSTLQKSTLIGGSDSNYVNAIAIDSTGRVYVTGYTTSTNYPVTSGAYDELHNGSSDVFISRFDAELSTLQKSTLIGGTHADSARAIAIDSTGRVYVTGETYDYTTDYPTTSGAYDETHNGQDDVFVSRFDAELSTLQKSTLIGGSDYDRAYAIAIDSTGRVYVTGYTHGIIPDYPITPGAYDETHNSIDADVFVSLFDAELSLDSPTVPDAPTSLTATAISSSEIELSWTAPADDGGSAITGYMINRDGEVIVEDTASTSTTYSDTGLESNTEYTYTVMAINSAGTSAESNEASATTDAETGSISFTASGTMAISKTVTKGDHQLEKSKKYNHEIMISATIPDGQCNAKGQIKKFSDITGTFTFTNEDLGVDEIIDLENIKLTHNSALKKFTFSADQAKGEFNFKSKVNCNEPEGQDGKGSKVTKLAADKAKFSSIKVTASDVMFG